MIVRPVTKTAATDNEILEITDENDRVTGTARRADIHRLGLMHRAVHVFLFNGAGEIYVQRRSPDKDRFPSVLDSSAAGHTDPGESYADTARRELLEELGIEADLQEILRVSAGPITDNEHVALFRASSDRKPRPNPEEIQWGEFMEPAVLTHLMETTPEDFVPAFIHLWNEYRRLST